MSVVQKGIQQALAIQQRLAWDPRRAVVLGAGPVGILAAAALRLRGIEVHVCALEPEGSFKDTHLRDAGISYVSAASTPIASLPERLGPIDIVFEATGSTSVVFPAMRILGPDGICILSSVTGGEKKVEVDLATWNRDMVLGNRLIFGTVNASRLHFEMARRDLEAVEELLPGWLSRLVTRRIPFTDAAQALERTADDIKTVLTFD
jgi:glucose 1-dehydrogenase